MLGRRGRLQHAANALVIDGDLVEPRLELVVTHGDSRNARCCGRPSRAFRRTPPLNPKLSAAVRGLVGGLVGAAGAGDDIGEATEAELGFDVFDAAAGAPGEGVGERNVDHFTEAFEG